MPAYWPARSDFERIVSRANTVPLYTQLLSDQLTPVSAFNRTAHEADHAFLLESVIGSEKVARYSFIAVDPTVVFEATGPDLRVSPLGHAQHVLRVKGWRMKAEPSGVYCRAR